MRTSRSFAPLVNESNAARRPPNKDGFALALEHAHNASTRYSAHVPRQILSENPFADVDRSFNAARSVQREPLCSSNTSLNPVQGLDDEIDSGPRRGSLGCRREASDTSRLDDALWLVSGVGVGATSTSILAAGGVTGGVEKSSFSHTRESSKPSLAASLRAAGRQLPSVDTRNCHTSMFEPIRSRSVSFAGQLSVNTVCKSSLFATMLTAGPFFEILNGIVELPSVDGMILQTICWYLIGESASAKSAQDPHSHIDMQGTIRMMRMVALLMPPSIFSAYVYE